MQRLDCLVRFIGELKVNCDSWTDNSLEPIIFGKLIQDCGKVLVTWEGNG